ncbi:MAG TPA: hypothetical protein DCR20_10425 [Planctomycetaceae bacterium]|nr:hypothetical protein [Planctomycetaceae bacterium]
MFVAGAVECLQHPTGGGGVAIQYGSGAAAGFDFVGGLEGQATFASDSIVATDAVLLQQGCGLCRESNFGRGGGGGEVEGQQGPECGALQRVEQVVRELGSSHGRNPEKDCGGERQATRQPRD